MNTFRFLTILLTCSFVTLNASAQSEDLDSFDIYSSFDPASKLSVDYTDLDSLLNALVLDTGRSDRKRARLYHAQTGTRLKTSINRATVLEGNKFYFEVFVNNPENQQTLQKIRSRLESIPSITPLRLYSRDEQLAYWLNLYNTTLLDEIVKTYPERELEELLVGKQSILEEKLLVVAGVPLSLNDIQFGILKQNYDNNPLIMYGLHQGIIGSPNIRKTAYTGRNVYANLNDNAVEFINSNRGTESHSARVFRVSSLYQRNQVYFDHFETDLSRHLLQYLEGEAFDKLQSATTIEADIDDWTITDLYGSSRDFAGSFANSTGVLGSDTQYHGNSSNLALPKANPKYTPAVLAHLNKLKGKSSVERIGTVKIEELGTAKPAAKENDS
jgi:hypothetical protein